MKIYIHHDIINQFELQDWAHDVGLSHQFSWIREIAQVITSWFDNQTHIRVATSGSTGIPKIIEHSKNSMKLSAQLTARRFGLTEGMTSLNCLPAQYIAGKMMLIRALVLGIDQICIEPKLVLRSKFDDKLDFVAMTPMQLSATLDNHPQLISQIRILILGGGPIMKNLNDKIQLLETQCFATYGMTETITHIATRPINGKHRTEIFKAVDNVRFEIEKGNLVIHAAHLDSTPIRTSDQVILNDDQHFSWLGRADNVINTGGIKVHPEQVEERLQDVIEERYIITSAPDDLSGQRVILIIESEGFNDDKMNFLQKYFLTLSKIERPKNILFVGKFLETHTGKIKRDLHLYISNVNLS